MLSSLLTIADKYAVQTIPPIVRERLADEKVLKRDAFGAYILARRWGFAEEAKRAARRLTFIEVMKSPSSKDPQNVTGEDFSRLLWFVHKRGDEAKRVIRAHLVSWNRGLAMTCGKHSDNETLEFFEALAEAVVEVFDIDPCLDVGKLVMVLPNVPDPPDTGFCKDIDSWPNQEYAPIYCPLQPSAVVSSLEGLALRLESICEEHLSEAFDGEFTA